AIDAVAHRLAKLASDVSFVFDGEIGNAAPGVELVRLWEGVGRADVEAAPADGAIVGLTLARGNLDAHNDRAKKQPRSKFARDEIGVFALPGDNGPRRAWLLPSSRV